MMSANASAGATEPGSGHDLPDGLSFQTIRFTDIDSWPKADLGGAFRALLNTCPKLLAEPPHVRGLGVPVDDLLHACRLAQDLPENSGNDQVRAFFETRFDPVIVLEDASEKSGFFTGYFEPSIAASPVKSPDYPVPLFGMPHDLVKVKDHEAPANWDEDMAYARLGPDGLEPYPDRAEIEDGYLEGRGLELAYVASPVDAFFIHVQGSATLRFADGTQKRVSFAAKNGHAYSSIGRILVEEEGFQPKDMTMQRLRSWLFDNPEAGRALMRRNRSFIFFRLDNQDGPSSGPVGAAGVPLRPDDSIAVDRSLHLFGTPVWIDVAVTLPDGRPARHHRRLTIAQDTGSAILGATRADIFTGTGPDAGEEAGIIRHTGRFVILWPKPAPDHGER